MTHYYLDFSNSRDECTSAFMAILAYPETKNEEEKANLQASLCYLNYRSRAELDMDWAVTPQLIKPIYAFRDKKQVDHDLKPLKRRLRDRMLAAKMAMAFLQEVELGESIQLPKNVERLTISQLAANLIEEVRLTESKNIETRIWRPSIPVIHLATATALVIDHLEKSGVEKPSIGHLLSYPDLIKQVIDISNQHADILIKSSKVSIKPEQLIRIYIR
jgi:rRNA-processing protein FCF1